MQDKYYQFEELNNGEIVSFYTKIPFNFSRKFVDGKLIDSQFKELEKDLDTSFKYIKYMKQAHDNNIKIVREKDLDIDCYEGYDGLITNIENVLLTTITADCQSILIYDSVNKVIGNIHSGWKGTLKRICSKAIKIMVEEFNSNVNDIIVCINPSMLKCCFEIEDDVVEMFNLEFGDTIKYITKGDIVNGRQKYYIDTIEINRDELLKMGIKKDNIHISSDCTKCNSNIYHSYRCEGAGTGQNLAGIMLKQ